MDKFKFFLLYFLFHSNSSMYAGYGPQLIQDSLKSLYPQIETVAWSTDHSYYVASFTNNGFYTKVWFDVKGHWVMKQTDWQTMDQYPCPFTILSPSVLILPIR